MHYNQQGEHNIQILKWLTRVFSYGFRRNALDSLVCALMEDWCWNSPYFCRISSCLIFRSAVLWNKMIRMWISIVTTHTHLKWGHSTDVYCLRTQLVIYNNLTHTFAFLQWKTFFLFNKVLLRVWVHICLEDIVKRVHTHSSSGLTSLYSR